MILPNHAIMHLLYRLFIDLKKRQFETSQSSQTRLRSFEERFEDKLAYDTLQTYAIFSSLSIQSLTSSSSSSSSSGPFLEGENIV